MSKSRSVTLLAPRIGPAVMHAIASRTSHWPQLARLAGRGSLACVPKAQAVEPDGLSRWQKALLDALELHHVYDRYPSAAVTRCGELGGFVGGFWMHATPMHFAAGLDRLTVHALRDDHRVVHAERAELEPAIAAHLRPAGFELLTSAGDEWLIRSERVLQVQLATPEAVLDCPLEQVMPRGPDAAYLRRLMTELQMVLHEHPVNLRRSQRGVPEVNALWLHGGGMLDGVPQPSVLPQGFGTDLYLRGVYRLNDDQPVAAPADAQELMSRLQGRAVGVIETDDLDALEAKWAAPLAHALAGARLAHLDLLLDNWRITVARSSLLRFWRRPRSPAEWAGC
jgi:hypothetical protein